MTAVSVETADRLNEIRRTLVGAGVEAKPATDMLMIAKVFQLVGDGDLVVDALLMTPRPQWLRNLIGHNLSLPPAPDAPPAGLAGGRGTE